MALQEFVCNRPQGSTLRQQARLTELREDGIAPTFSALAVLGVLSWGGLGGLYVGAIPCACPPSNKKRRMSDCHDRSSVVCCCAQLASMAKRAGALWAGEALPLLYRPPKW